MDSTSVPFGIVVGVRRVRELRVLVLRDRFRDDLGLVDELVFESRPQIIVGVVVRIAWILQRHVVAVWMLREDS